MIKYKFGEIDCKISFEDFLSITILNNKLYKSNFKEFSELYEYIEKNLYKISHILFDGYEYFLQNGKLHNLYGPSIIKYIQGGYNKGPISYFYINGKLVCTEITNDTDRGCRHIQQFQNTIIYHHEEITNKKNSRRKEGIDYIRHYINLKEKIIIDQRMKKLKIINNIF